MTRPPAFGLTARFGQVLRGLLPSARTAPVPIQTPGPAPAKALSLSPSPPDRRDPADLIQAMPIEASGRWNVSLRDVSLRPYPFPYVAGLALANEYSYADPELFETVHAFLNGRSATPFGEGLGLEVGDSLAFAENGAAPVPDGWGDPGRGERLRRLVEAGWIDCIHAPGRAASASAAAALADWPPGGRPSVFLGPADAAVRAELSKLGVRYFGDDGPWLEIDKFGDHHDHKIAERFRLAADDYDWSRWSRYLTDVDAAADARTLVGLMNQTLPAAGQHTGHGHLFKRYSGPWLPSMPTFSAQVTNDLLNRLTQLAGVVVVQQQLGRWSLIGAAPEASEARPNRAPALDRHAVAVWRDIADRHTGGVLWVATTARLLDHLWRRQALAFSVTKKADRWVITLNELRCPLAGRRAIEASDLNGLSFTVGEAAPEVVVTVAGWAQPLEMRRVPDPAHRHRHAVYRPWAALEWIEP